MQECIVLAVKNPFAVLNLLDLSNIRLVCRMFREMLSVDEFKRVFINKLAECSVMCYPYIINNITLIWWNNPLRFINNHFHCLLADVAYMSKSGYPKYIKIYDIKAGNHDRARTKPLYCVLKSIRPNANRITDTTLQGVYTLGRKDDMIVIEIIPINGNKYASYKFRILHESVFPYIFTISIGTIRVLTISYTSYNYIPHTEFMKRLLKDAKMRIFNNVMELSDWFESVLIPNFEETDDLYKLLEAYKETVV